jgi:hypothetical protein
MITGNQPNQRKLAADVDLKNTTPVACEKCSNESFIQTVHLRKVSALLTGGPQDGYLPIQVFSCAACAHTNAQFLPEEMRPVSLAA